MAALGYVNWDIKPRNIVVNTKFCNRKCEMRLIDFDPRFIDPLPTKFFAAGVTAMLGLLESHLEKINTSIARALLKRLEEDFTTANLQEGAWDTVTNTKKAKHILNLYFRSPVMPRHPLIVERKKPA
jgi:hypothetical protein